MSVQSVKMMLWVFHRLIWGWCHHVSLWQHVTCHYTLWCLQVNTREYCVVALVGSKYIAMRRIFHMYSMDLSPQKYGLTWHTNMIFSWLRTPPSLHVMSRVTIPPPPWKLPHEWNRVEWTFPITSSTSSCGQNCRVIWRRKHIQEPLAQSESLCTLNQRTSQSRLLMHY